MYSDDELLRRMKMLTWDTTQSATDLLRILKEGATGKNTQEQNSLYIKILNWFPWHQVREMVPETQLHYLLEERVIQGLFPRDLRDKYRYVRSLL